MTSTSMSWKRSPFLLKPAAKDYLWGGTRLNDDFSKNIDFDPLAETWECSVHPDGLSIVASGEFKGMTLADVIKLHPEFLGSNNEAEGEIPILVKLIDAKKDLSVQVHPDDEYAFRYENGQRGKTEMWYVVDATHDAELVHGFNVALSKDQLKKSIEDGTVERYLRKVPVHRNDVFLIEAGMVHAIGAGALIAEIQESSNLTYRMYDYNRVDKNGNKRELHVEKALDVVRLSSSDDMRQPMRVLRYQKGMASEFLCRCKYFQVERILINTERNRELAEINVDSTSFNILLCIGGCGVLIDSENTHHMFFKGDCIFIPADSGSVRIHGGAQFLRIKC